MGEDKTTWPIFIFWRTLELERREYIFVLQRLNPSISKTGVGGGANEGGGLNVHPAHLDAFQRLHFYYSSLCRTFPTSTIMLMFNRKLQEKNVNLF